MYKLFSLQFVLHYFLYFRPIISGGRLGPIQIGPDTLYYTVEIFLLVIQNTSKKYFIV